MTYKILARRIMLGHAPCHTLVIALFATRFTLAQNTGMAKPANKIEAQAASDVMHYEQPLSERMRTFLRLEFLYQQMLYNTEQEADWATRAIIATLLEVLAILSRGDVRSDVSWSASRASPAWTPADSTRLSTISRQAVPSSAASARHSCNP